MLRNGLLRTMRVGLLPRGTIAIRIIPRTRAAQPYKRMFISFNPHKAVKMLRMTCIQNCVLGVGELQHPRGADLIFYTCSRASPSDTFTSIFFLSR